MIRALARFAVGNPVTVNLATAAVAAAGVLAYLSMPREVFPDFSLGTVTVATVYPGAAPEDVERLVTLPLEERLEGLDGKREITSVSQEGYSRVTLLVQPEADMSDFLEDVRTAVTSGDLELPEACEEPLIREIESEFPAIGVFIYGPVAEEELRAVAEAYQRGLERIPGVARVLLQGEREPRLWVEVDPVALERFGLALEDVGRAVAGRTRDVPLGSLTTDSGDYLLRVDSGVEAAEDLRDLFVIHRPDGTGVKLSELARVVDTFERVVTRARFMGQPCLYLQVNKAPRGDAIDISKAVHAFLEGERAGLPVGVAVGTSSDLSVYVKNRLRVMQGSAILGGMLVLISLIVFLNLRVALVTALGIPLAFLGGLVLAHALGLTMNMLTMFALIVVLGMIVDDAIVVGENAYRLMEEGLSPLEAAIQGTAEVGRPVIATILTTVAAFLPTLLIGGTMGEFMRPLPLIVTFCLLASLAEALLVLPAHLAHGARAIITHRGEAPRRWYDPVRRGYERLLGFVVRWRYVTLASTATALVLLVGVALAHIPFSLFDDFESKVFSVNLRAHPGTPLRETEIAVAEIEALVARLPEHELESTHSVVGVSYTDATRFTIGQHLAQVWVELHEDERARRPTHEVIEELRTVFADALPEQLESLDITQPQAGPTGRAIDLSLRGPDAAVLERLAEQLAEELRAFRGVRDVHENARPGKREVRLCLTDAGRLLGYDEAGLGRELRSAFEGTRFASVRRGNDDVEVVVKLPEELRNRRGVLAALPVGSLGGSPVPLGDLAELSEATGPASITRDEGERSVRVVADVNKDEGNAGDITAALAARWADLGERYPGYSLEFKGEQADADESLEGLVASLLLALVLIYMILGSLFRSLTQPMVVMSAIPFGIFGMILGHLVMGRSLSFMSLIGLVALAGIVVNDSLILLDFINTRRRAGEGLAEALRKAGGQRFRPIVLTSITTMLGISPLAFFASGQARFLQPMAITLFFGLAASTLLILLTIPCAYAVWEDVMLLLRRPAFVLGRLWRGEPLHDVAPAPAPFEENPA